MEVTFNNNYPRDKRKLMYLNSKYVSVQRGYVPDKNEPVKYAVRKPMPIEVKKPVTNNNVRVFSGIKKVFTPLADKVVNAVKTYAKNIEHTYEHKIIFSILEKKFFGKNSINCVTHDSDKLALYTLGFPKKFVSKFHRSHSEHHAQSGKKLNLSSVFVDNVASSPALKPEKSFPLRQYYGISLELRNIKGLGDMLKKHNFGEDVDFEAVKRLKATKYSGFKGVVRAITKTLSIIAKNI